MTSPYPKVRKAVMPVAGLGTRFLPATKAMPKEMLTVVDKPVIQYAVEEAIAAGIEEIIFVTGRGKAAIENHFDEPYELAQTLEKKGKLKELQAVRDIIPPHVRLVYTRQGSPKGLGHAIGCAANLIGDEPFAVLLPDDIIHSPSDHALTKMITAYNTTGKSVVLSQEVPENRVKNYGILDLGPNGQKADTMAIQGFVEKPDPSAAPSRMGVIGRYILTPAHFAYLKEGRIGAGGEIQLTDAMAEVCQKEGFTGVLFNGERFDCGDKVGFQMANLFFAMKDPYIAERLQPFLQELTHQTDRRTNERHA